MDPSSKIHVEYLCNQPFWNFKKSGNNSFCKVCKENIHDFTSSEIQSVKQKITGNGGQICGSFYKEQFVIDEYTQKSPNHLKMLLVGAISMLTATFKLEAQKLKNDSAKVEQLQSPNQTNTSTSRDSLNSRPITASSDTTKPSTEASTHKKVNRGARICKIGNRTFYISWRPLFFHSYYAVRGRVCYSKGF